MHIVKPDNILSPDDVRVISSALSLLGFGDREFLQNLGNCTFIKCGGNQKEKKVYQRLSCTVVNE